MRCCRTARAQAERGHDVVVGVVETHGRKETEALARRPGDRSRASASSTRAASSRRWISTPSSRAGRSSFSSTNSPIPTRRAAATPSAISMSRNCSNNGIDVYTTLNIQHIESLNDVVAQITHVRVRETVPDSILDRADDIELVDITPERPDPAAEGRQGLRSQASRARARAFFLARQSDGAARARAAAHGRARRRAAAQRDAGAGDLRALGGRRAHAGLHQRGPARGRARALRQAPGRPSARPLDRALRRNPAQPAAHRGGARSHRRHAAPRASARRRGGHHSRRRPPHRRRCRSLTRKQTTSRRSSSANRRGHAGSSCSMARWCTTWCVSCGNISVHVIAGEELDEWRHPARRPCARADGAAPFDRASLPDRQPRGRSSRLGVGEILLAVDRAREHRSRLPDRRSSASPCASACGRRCSPASRRRSATISSSLPPYYTFTIADPRNVVAFVFFTVVAVIVSNVAARARSSGCCGAMGRARTTESLYAFSRKLAGVGDARRRAVGHGLPDRADAEGARGPAAAGERLDRGQGRLSARGHARSGRSRRGEMGLGAQSRRPAAAPTRCPGPSGCSCRCAPVAAPSAWSASTATRRARFSRPTSAACSMR